MKKFLLGLAVIALAVSCKDKSAAPQLHGATVACGSCHAAEQAQWASPNNLHALSAAHVVTNVPHNTDELLANSCLNCHAPFQVPLGVAHFVTPVNQLGSPAGTWTVLNASDWEATKCEVCHDPSVTDSFNLGLAKYGAVLDGDWSASYTAAAALPAAYQNVISTTTGATSVYNYPDQTTTYVQATKLCHSCHDPADQGSGPDSTIAGIHYGPQGGDSRSYVTTSHQGLGCTQCHVTHDFTAVNPDTFASCNTSCHSTSRVGTFPGKVHVNHL